MSVEEDANGVVKSADRALDVIELLASWGQQLSHSEIAAALGIPKSSLTKLLKNLTTRNYLQFVPETKAYRLGDAFLKLVQRLSQTRDLAAFAQPILEELTRQVAESSALNQLKGDQVEIVATVTSQQRLVSHLQLRDLAPLYAVSGGKAILAFLPEAMRKEYLQKVEFARYTPKTLTSVKATNLQLDEIRRTGVAASMEEYTPGIVGIGVPVLSDAGFPLASINVAVPSVRFNPKVRAGIVAALQSAVERLRKHLAPD